MDLSILVLCTDYHSFTTTIRDIDIILITAADYKGEEANHYPDYNPRTGGLLLNCIRTMDYIMGDTGSPTDYHRDDQHMIYFVFGGPASTPTALRTPSFMGIFYCDDFADDDDYTYHSQLGSPNYHGLYNPLFIMMVTGGDYNGFNTIEDYRTSGFFANGIRAGTMDSPNFCSTQGKKK